MIAWLALHSFFSAAFTNGLHMDMATGNTDAGKYWRLEWRPGEFGMK